MIQNKKYSYGAHDGLHGLEASFKLIGSILYIRIQGSNIWRDYVDCFLYAWPRVRPLKNRRIAFHRKWWSEAEKFREHLGTITAGEEINEYQLLGHSAGGAQVYALSFLLPPRRITITTINAPRFGNRAAGIWINPYAICRSLFDAGDIVRRWPIFYARNPNPEQYGHTKGLEKAHINFPKEWREFPV